MVLYIVLHFILIFNRVKWALLVGDVFLYAAAIGNYFVLAFRGTPITPADIYALGTAMDVADHYVLSYDKPAIVATVVLLGLCVFACKLDTYKIFHWKKRLVALLITAIVTVGSSFFLTRVDFFVKERCCCKLLATEERILKKWIYFKLFNEYSVYDRFPARWI